MRIAVFLRWLVALMLAVAPLSARASGGLEVIAGLMLMLALIGFFGGGLLCVWLNRSRKEEPLDGIATSIATFVFGGFIGGLFTLLIVGKVFQLLTS
jgi:hypothetical protein